MHSWGLLSQTLQTTLSNNKELPSWLAQLLHSLVSVSSIDPHEHGHSHSDEGESLSPSAILFPLFGILVKEYLYRATKKVAEEQNSSVLMANAMHHRSDAYSSIVTIVAILGSLIWESVPVDPMGGKFLPSSS
jgi:divalent metal cation (Fe/Co/Zn/Cd) transporter